MSKHNDDCAGRNGAPNHGKHTPGPWASRKATASVPTTHVYSSTGHIASAMGKNHEANARLIAAAPDLLEACRQALGCDLDPATNALILAAIAKAEGRS